MEQALTTRKRKFERFQAALSSSTTLSDLPLTTDLPTNAVPVEDNALMLSVFGVGADGDICKVRVVGLKWTDAQYIPIELAEFTATLSTKTGESGQPIDDTVRFADILVVNFGGDGVEVYSPANNQIAHALVDLQGCGWYILVLSTEGSASGVNALVCTL